MQAAALTLLATTAQAQQAFSSAWFAAKGAGQSAAQQTGRLPNGMPVSALTSPSAQQQQASAELQRSIANLGAAAQSIAAMQAAQASARAAAANGSVPDGLAEGGLKVDTNSLTQGWINANAPTQTVANGTTNVNIQQTADKAILNWETFNVGRNTSVNFGQQSDWAVLNRVNDPQARPSQIQGQIHGDGTVLVVNRNGVIFSGTSQVDTRNLVAAAAKVSDGQFKSNGIYGANGTTPSFTEALGKVEVQAGAQIATRAPGSVTRGGGYVMLLGSEVSNAGTIATPRGQTALAAGDSFVIRKGYGTDANQVSTTRGSEIAPQFVAGSSAGKVVNSGLILATEGDVTLAGRDVQQLGVAVATTTVNQRGTIHLLSSAADTQGRVTLGPGAVTAVLIDDDGKTTALDSQRDALIQDSAAQDLLRAGAAMGVFDNLSRLSDRRDQSRVEIVSGGNVDFQGDSLTLATAGQLAVSATGRSFVANRAQLDVSGAVGVSLAMDTNNVKVNVQGNEQRDAPGNRDSGKLLNANVWLDRRRLLYVPAGVGGYANERWYTAGGLLELGGYLANQGHRIGEWAAQGGTVTLGGTEVVTQAGSSINLSGGSLNVQTGYLRQTWLKGADGLLYNANNAPAGVQYTGVYTGFDDEHPRWGKNATDSYASAIIAPQRVLQNGYTVGRDAGRLNISAPTAVLEGDVLANVFNGAQQTQARAANAGDSYKLAQNVVARPGQLQIAQISPIGGGLSNGYGSDVKIDNVAPIGPLGLADALPANRANTVWLDAGKLSAEGLGGLTLVTQKRIAINADLALANGGALSLVAPEVDVGATVTARGGSVSLGNAFTSADTGMITALLPAVGTPAGTSASASAAKPSITLAPGTRIDTRGLWTNLLQGAQPDDYARLAYTDGGAVTIRTNGDVTLPAGASIDASAGGAILANGKNKGGAGGDIALIAGYAYGNNSSALDNGVLTLNGTLASSGFTHGGHLTLASSGIVVIGDAKFDLGTSLNVGQYLPINVTLTQDVVWPAGAPLPAAASVTALTTVPTGVLASNLTLPNLSTANPLVLTADLVLAPNGIPATNFTGYPYQLPNGQWGVVWPAGSAVIPKGSKLVYPIIFLAGKVTVQGGPLNLGIVTTQYLTGDVAPAAVTFHAGDQLQGGVPLAVPIQFQPLNYLRLAPALLSSGFASYDILGNGGLRVGADSAIHPTEPILRLTQASYGVATGADPAATLEHYVAPVYTENPAHDRLSQRPGVDLSLSGGHYNPANSQPSTGWVSIADGASIEVDPGHKITLSGTGTINVEGTLRAPGGAIALVDTYGAGSTLMAHNPANRAMWIGDHAVLDVSGSAYVAHDLQGRAYGVAPAGGTITFGRAGTDGLLATTGIAGAADAFIVIRPGAVLDASGTSATFDTIGGGGLLGTVLGTATQSQPFTLASDGGSISMASYDGIYSAGTLRAAAGGAGASGGALNVMLETPYYPLAAAGGYGVDVAPKVQVGRVLNIGGAAAPGFPNGNVLGGLLAVGGAIGANAITAGGFDTVSLGARDAVAFAGDVTLGAGRAITLNTSAVYDSVSGGHVSLAAPYVLLDGTVNADIPLGYARPSMLPAALTGTTGGVFATDAGLLDVRNALSINFADASLTSHGDLRFLAATSPASLGVAELTSLNVPNGNLELRAEQVYPDSGAVAQVSVGLSADRSTLMKPSAVLSILSVDGTRPAVPYSVFGSLAFAAPTIRQGGVVRAPLGSITLASGLQPQSRAAGVDGTVELLPGSLTSVSGSGLAMPYGGTTDGVTYTVNGVSAPVVNLITGQFGNGLAQGITVTGTRVIGDKVAAVDLSGGGTLLGAGFVSGRGGSVDVLSTPLVNANPTLNYGNASDKVFAILPSLAAGATAPSTANAAGVWTGDTPQVGQQVTIPAGVPGLPAGTYTLLPANYALLPGAYRVELGAKTQTPMATPSQQANGSYLLSGTQSVAHTAIHDALSTQLIVTPGDKVRTYSQYDEQSYADFQTARAATFGLARPLLPEDGKLLTINLLPPILPTTVAGSVTAPALQFSGDANFAPEQDAQGAQSGYGGALAVTAQGYTRRIGPPSLVIVGPGSTLVRTQAQTTVSSDSINAFGAPTLYLNGVPTVSNDGTSILLSGNIGTNTTLTDGAVLTAARVVVGGRNITLSNGAGITTLGRGAQVPDTASTGYLFSNGNVASLLVVSNGDDTLYSATRPMGAISIGNGSFLYANGMIGFLAANGVTFTGRPKLGASKIGVAAPSINIGTSGVLAVAATAGTLPAGFNVDQTLLNLLLAGDPSVGAPATKDLVLAATQSINFYGSVALNTADATTGQPKLQRLVLQSPAIYGAGGAGDKASITTDTLVWNGNYRVVGTTNATGAARYGAVLPGATVAGGPGSGLGVFEVDARRIVFGYPNDAHSPKTLSLDRLMLGFSTTSLNASESITANDKGTLDVFQSGASPTATYNAASYTGTGGALNLSTPLVTGDPGAILKIRAGGALTAAAPAGVAPSTAKPSALGAEIDFSGSSVTLDTAVYLPSGRLSVTADGDVTLGNRAQIDLSGRAIPFYDITKYSWGGDALLESTHGNIVQAAGSVIDLSSQGNDAGTLSVTATGPAAGLLALGGTLRGAGGNGFNGGSIDVRAQRIGDPANLTADFSALNTRLTGEGLTQGRSFDLKQGSLVIDDALKAHAVAVSIDGGSLTVNGTVDASGGGAGSVRLAARDGLTVNGTLDAHGTALRVDSNGVAIGASNAPKIELATVNGALTLAPGAVFNLRSADNVARGTLTLDAPRVGAGASATGAGAPADATGGDIAISAAGRITIRGARSIALNGFARYANAPYQNGNPATNTQVITQGWLGLVDQDSTAFVNSASANAGLQSRLAGLTAYGPAFHLRPGVEIDSATLNGDLIASGSIDLAGYRYGANANRNTASSTYGAGEPMDFVLRAGGNVTVNGSISDGFGPPSPALSATSNAVPALPAGALSASIRLAAGADLAAADMRTLLPGSALAGKGNMLLSDYHSYQQPGIFNSMVETPIASTIRTGAADLDILAGGNFSQQSLYNISTAGRGDAAPADLFVNVQGALSSYVWLYSGSPNFQNSAAVTNWIHGNQGTRAYYDGFTGFGALNGGNVTIKAGGDAGAFAAFSTTPVSPYAGYLTGSSLVAASAGGGDVRVAIGGRLNPDYISTQDITNWLGSVNGTFTDLRGDLSIKAGAIGAVPLAYGLKDINDPRRADPGRAAAIFTDNSWSAPYSAITVVAGDGTTSLATRGDLALGRVGADATAAWWTPTTAVNLFSAGGNLVPITTANLDSNARAATNLGATSSPTGVLLPPIFSATAASGSIYYGGGTQATQSAGSGLFRLAPSAHGQLELLAQDSIYGAAYASANSSVARFEMQGADSDATLHVGDTNPMRIYAVHGNLVDVTLGETYSYQAVPGGSSSPGYVAAKAADVRAGGDIVNFGYAQLSTDLFGLKIAPSLILNTNTTDVSRIQAGGNIYYLNVQVAGPGSLEVTAGGNIYQGDKGSITSIGPIAQGDTRPGASIAVQAGAGSAGPDWAALAALYLNPANQADLTPGHPLADQPGKVAHTYDQELAAWLKERYGFVAADAADALKYFNALAPEQQRVFVRSVYYAELKAGGREYNDPASSRYGSYLRGRDMIATLFPAADAKGNSIARGGSFTQFGGSGIQTEFGGDIQMLVPAGKTVVGVEGAVPPASAGLLTQGAGDIDLYSKGSILLGLSRIMTTFGGSILGWSAEGDINAGRGAKTTVVYTPPKRVYDGWGNVKLSPSVPSSGAGIATLSPIPEVPAGDVDLIAPLGTIDAGEAGIRVSGNVNFAALQVVNAANVQVQGKSTGLPVVANVNVGALTNASAAASQAASAAQDAVSRDRAAARQAMPSIFSVRMLGTGNDTAPSGGGGNQRAPSPDRQERSSYDPASAFQMIGNGPLTEREKMQLTSAEKKNLVP